MSDLTQSLARISFLVERALECVDSGSDPRSGDVWWVLAASTLPAQLLELEAAVRPGTVTVAEAPFLVGADTAAQCLGLVQAELASWDWDRLDRDTLRAGARLVLDVSDLLRLP